MWLYGEQHGRGGGWLMGFLVGIACAWIVVNTLPKNLARHTFILWAVAASLLGQIVFSIATG